MTREPAAGRGPSAALVRPNRSLFRPAAVDEDLTEQGIDPMLVHVNFNAEQRTAGLSIARVKELARLAPASTRHLTSPARPTRDEHHDRHPGPTPPGVATRGIDQPHAHAYLPFVRRRTIGLDPAHAPALAGHHEAVLPHERLHQLPRAAARARHRRLPGVRVHPASELALRRSPDRRTLRPSH